MKHSYYCLSSEAVNLPRLHNITEKQFDVICSLVEQVVGDSTEENNLGSH